VAEDRTAATTARVVYFEEDGRERQIRAYCKVCKTDPDDFPNVIVSPAGVAHTQHWDGYEKMVCGANGAGEDWWWPL
jgi:hypothetical protein